MSTEPIIKSESPFTEAPASWNTSYVTPEGFVCRITLRGDTGKDLLEKAALALAFLLEHGYVPEPRQQQRPNHNYDSKGERKNCLIHLCGMKRFEKNGRTWFSHKLQDGTWCRGRKQ